MKRQKNKRFKKKKEQKKKKEKKKKPNIIIEVADNGSVVVILNKTYYRTKTQEILKDFTNYKLIDTNIDNNISKITKFCKTPNKTLTKKDFLICK